MSEVENKVKIVAPWWEERQEFDYAAEFEPAFWNARVLFERSLRGEVGCLHRIREWGILPPNVSANRFMKKLLALKPDGRIIVKNHGKTQHSPYTDLIVWGDSSVSISGSKDFLRVEGLTADVPFFKAIKKLTKKYLKEEVSDGHIFVLTAGAEGPSLRRTKKAGTPIIRENYEQSVIDSVDVVLADLASPSPSGRLTVFEGEPGTGKTYLVRGILDHVKRAKFVFTPPNLIPEIAGPQLIPVILNARDDDDEDKSKGPTPLIFVIEDADKCLLPRAGDNLGEISNILNLTDGILGSAFDIRIIATTNAKVHEIDSALLRPGRLNKHISVERLSIDKGVEVYQRLTKKDAPDGFKAKQHTLAEIYAMARDGGWDPVKEAATENPRKSKKVTLGFGS